MNFSEFIELILVAALFLLDFITLRWLYEKDRLDTPPRLIRHYLFYRQHTLSRYFPSIG